MKKKLALAVLLLPVCTFAQDPVVTDGDKYKVLLENDQVRVLSYSDQPGDKTHQHQHPAFVVYALAPFKRKLILADGKTVEREFKTGDVFYSTGETHAAENIGDTPTKVILVEIKPKPTSESAVKAQRK